MSVGEQAVILSCWAPLAGKNPLLEYKRLKQGMGTGVPCSNRTDVLPGCLEDLLWSL